MAKPVAFPSVAPERRKPGRPPSQPAAPAEKRSATVVRLPDFHLRVASTIGALRGTDRTEVVRDALDRYFVDYPEIVARVRQEMGLN